MFMNVSSGANFVGSMKFENRRLNNKALGDGEISNGFIKQYRQRNHKPKSTKYVSLRRQDISSHDIDYVEHVGPGLTWGRILSTCVISMWSNDTKCNYMFIFLLQNLARKELIVGSTRCRGYGPQTIR